jgi:MCM P-loop domain
MPRHSDRHRKFLEDIERLLASLKKLPLSSVDTAQVSLAHDDLLYSIRDLAQREQLPEESLETLEAKVRDYLDLLSRRGDLSWNNVEYHEIVSLRDPLMEGRAIKVRVHLEELLEPVAVLNSDGKKHLATRMTFRELDGPERVESIPTINTPLVRRLQQLKREHHVFDVLATIFLMPAHFGERFCLLVHDMRPSETSLQMIQAKSQEISKAQRTLADFKQTGTSVFNHILTTLVREIGIHGLEAASELNDSLEAVIVQAFSDGWVRNASGKLHTLIIGAPAVGKKLLTEAARVLNPVFYEAHPSKATVAGVCSTAKQEKGVWRSEPGYLPLAHRGVFAIQDFHAVKNAEREKLLGVFNMVMEDGKAYDSTAARQKHPALTSIHLDMNKRTDLFPDSQLRGETIVAKRLDDIQIPMTILSRFDFIIDIPRDIQRQIEVALAMYDRSVRIVAPANAAQKSPEWARHLQVLVALLRTEHEEIVFPAEIMDVMQQKHQALLQRIENLLDQRPWLSDIQTRLANTAAKFVAAYARMNDRQSPLLEDVERAFRLLSRKFEFIATLAQQLQVPATWETSERVDLDRWLQSRFAGQQVKTGEILKEYEKAFNIPLERRTLDRHIPQVARNIRQGLWAFPPYADENVA